jgi:hypothetical protein
VAGVGQQGFVDWPDKTRLCGSCRHPKGDVLAGRPPKLHAGGRCQALCCQRKHGAGRVGAHIVWHRERVWEKEAGGEAGGHPATHEKMKGWM